MSKSSSIAIIGAGIAGLSAAKSLLEKGMNPVLFEKSNKFGGLWNYGKPESPLYRSLKVNVSKQMMSFSDFRFDNKVPDFPSHEQVLAFIKNYVKEYEIEKYIQFGSEVKNVAIEKDGFIITVKKSDRVTNHKFTKLIVASGRFEIPNIPHIDGINTFKGKIIHSKNYDGPTPFKEKNVCIVGAAASGLEIANELTDIAKSINISMRNSPWVIPKTINGKPIDHSLNWFKSKIPKKIREVGFKKILLKEYAKRKQDISKLPFNLPKLDLDRTRLVPQETLISLMLSGKIIIHDCIKTLSGRHAITYDDKKIEIDHIIFATGYKTEFPFFNSEDVRIENNYIGLYKHIFHPKNPNLAFIGMCNIVGAAFPMFEMQSRFVAEVFEGNIKLPNKKEIENQVNSHKVKCLKKNIDPMRVQTLSYLDELASIIGVAPKFRKNIDVLKSLLFGPLTAYRYRLNGPGAKPLIAKKLIKL